MPFSMLFSILRTGLSRQDHRVFVKGRQGKKRDRKPASSDSRELRK